VALGIICSALMTWAVYFSTSFDLRQLMYWMMGGFGGVDWQQGWLMAAGAGHLWACLQAQPLNMLALGETSARQLGMPMGSGVMCWSLPLAGWSASAWRWRARLALSVW
jgi:vitamin B12 transport system permease protein